MRTALVLHGQDNTSKGFSCAASGMLPFIRIFAFLVCKCITPFLRCTPAQLLLERIFCCLFSSLLRQAYGSSYWMQTGCIGKDCKALFNVVAISLLFSSVGKKKKKPQKNKNPRTSAYQIYFAHE